MSNQTDSKSDLKIEKMSGNGKYDKIVILNDYKLANESRQMSILGRK